MGSQGDGSNSNGGIQSQARIQIQDPNSNPLGRQGSLYSLTLDEVQSQLGDLGKPLSSMNLDELLKTVWTAEANNQSMGGVNHEPGPGLNHPSTDISKKTVEEVWQDIQQGQKRNSLDRKATLGEITLEDFLVKAGVVAESSNGGKKNLGPVVAAPDPTGLPQQAQWMNYQNVGSVFIRGYPGQQPMPIGGNGIMDATYPGPSSPLMGTLSETQTPGRKRVAPDEIVEKSVQRRQKRMIKNRESAARSRARKQAYTHELENKVSRLEEENERLKRQKELETMLPIIPPPEPKNQLRRTSSAPIWGSC
ncbi:hypothetical protein BUALT_Bualt12G0048400 [Buddleja alternifolia]|uniref:BZIP domain-containing protein n=1 Tax=Buddleja alternifolia TaxID=168488 RepID=A0AAV6WZ60_9LAMI|nr:hypothetical protein BUALT_Bualt12G0048400 [Buddleja alternifolia]